VNILSNLKHLCYSPDQSYTDIYFQYDTKMDLNVPNVLLL